MLICGYIRKKLKHNQIEMEEASIAAEPNELRKLANFILDCAEQIESEVGFDHEHFRDRYPEEEHKSDFVVLNPKFSLEGEIGANAT